MELGIFYIFLCFIVGALGKKTFIGFWGNFIFALFLTPLIPLIYILISVNKDKKSELPLSK
jgi:ABC-type multidrug transport system permease subunit